MQGLPGDPLMWYFKAATDTAHLPSFSSEDTCEKWFKRLIIYCHIVWEPKNGTHSRGERRVKWNHFSVSLISHQAQWQRLSFCSASSSGKWQSPEQNCREGVKRVHAEGEAGQHKGYGIIVCGRAPQEKALMWPILRNPGFVDWPSPQIGRWKWNWK